MKIYFDSKTGNVNRFVNKLKSKDSSLEIVKITLDTIIDDKAHLITYTTKIGKVPDITREFLINNYKQNKLKDLLTVSSSGNRNWGQYFGVSADLINQKFNTDILMKFELSGTNMEVEEYLERIKKYGR